MMPTRWASTSTSGAGDFTLMVHTAPSNEAQGGTDDVAYVAYGYNSLGLRNTSGIITPPGNEAPILFERQAVGQHVHFFQVVRRQDDGASHIVSWPLKAIPWKGYCPLVT